MKRYSSALYIMKTFIIHYTVRSWVKCY